jgi:hypothetical protein
MTNVSILCYDNAVGLRRDAILLNNLLLNEFNSSITYLFNQINLSKSDIGIWIQNYIPSELSKFKKNIYYINEEWSGNCELDNLHLFDYIITKSDYGKSLLKPYHKNVINLGFFSKNIFNPTLVSDRFIHFGGKSIQKNTELVVNTFYQSTIPLTLLHSIDKWDEMKSSSNVKYHHYYLSDDDIFSELNSHSNHICCSLYETWGHYLYEGLSTGNEIICSSIPTFTENLDPSLVHFIPQTNFCNLSYEYVDDSKRFPLRKWFFSDTEYFKNLINNFNPIGKSKEKIDLFNQIMTKNQVKTLDFFNNI